MTQITARLPRELLAALDGAASQQLARLDPERRRLLVEQFDRLAVDPHMGTVLKGELGGLTRARRSLGLPSVGPRSFRLLLLGSWLLTAQQSDP